MKRSTAAMIFLSLPIFLAFPAFRSAWAQSVGRSIDADMWQFGWIFGPIMMIFVLFVLVVAAVLLVRWLSGTAMGSHLPRHETAIDILKMRYARGEIDKEEYEERRRLLRES